MEALLSCLGATTSPDPALRQQAEAQLAASTTSSGFSIALIQIALTQTNDLGVRQSAAGSCSVALCMHVILIIYIRMSLWVRLTLYFVFYVSQVYHKPFSFSYSTLDSQFSPPLPPSHSSPAQST